jgi:hypothetical protein
VVGIHGCGGGGGGGRYDVGCVCTHPAIDAILCVSHCAAGIVWYVCSFEHNPRVTGCTEGGGEADHSVCFTTFAHSSAAQCGLALCVFQGNEQPPLQWFAP